MYMFISKIAYMFNLYLSQSRVEVYFVFYLGLAVTETSEVSVGLA